MNILQTIETDLKAAGQWLEKEFESAAKAVWSVVIDVFNQQEPALVASVLGAIKTYLLTLEQDVINGTTIPAIETEFLKWAEAEGGSLLQDALKVGSTLVQALIALAIKDLPKAP